METSDFVLFLGRFHPLVLHVPIGFLILAFVLEVLARFDRFRQYRPVVGIILLLGAVSAAVAAALGYLLAQGGGYNEDLLFIHQWSGIGVAFIAAAAFVLNRRMQSKPSVLLNKAYLATLMLMVLFLSMAGHFGGSLTHGSDYLTKYMPNSLRMIAGLPEKQPKEIKKITNLNEAVVYSDIIYPILDMHCTSCHNETKRKGELMMHTPEDLMKGGEGGPALVAGNAANSDMIKRIHLPESDEDHMPPEGKSQLSDDQIDLLVWWVNEGASFDKKVAELNKADDVQAILNGLVDSSANKTEVEILLSSAVAPVNEQTLALLQGKGIIITPLSNEIHWLQADVAPSRSGDSLVNAFTKVSEQLTWLNLGGTSTTDKGLSAIGKFKNLTRLHLGNTGVTDEGLKFLKDLPYLESLNLYGTRVTDDGINQLAGLKNLKKLFVWQTQVTKEGAARLQEALPGLEINMGLSSDPKKETTPADPALAKK